MEDQTKKSKKFAVGDLPPSPTTSTTKRPTRHHVKRRSSGRVHVTKLAPMMRAHEDDDRKSMKRSHSSKSLHRLNSNERKLGINGFTPAVAPVQPQTTTTITKEQEPPTDTTIENTPPTTNDTTSNNTDTTMKKKPLLVRTQTAPALPPVEQTLSVTANELVSPDKPVFNDPRSLPSTNNNNNKQLLKSQFVEPPPLHNKIRVATSQPLNNNMTRTQQKLMLQREQTLVSDENSVSHPKNMLRLTREMEKIGREYRCVKRYEDPMMASLMRCQQKKERPGLINTRTMSSSVLPTKEFRPHYDQRRRILLNAALYKNEKEQQHEYNEDVKKKPTPWSAFLDRLLYG
ncbi:hypothetical protein K501DRAFT_284666 [Backusella circina FSU 941]|nr:hypothetical protein K501DRAFT_284666 [Backusella circina FSU 941]